ncbi:hypothetical protein LUZ60_003057 [Juncus effusus]|nr:hypothetical protein LUZ60_003057 [Juncus effusus]
MKKRNFSIFLRSYMLPLIVFLLIFTGGVSARPLMPRYGKESQSQERHQISSKGKDGSDDDQLSKEMYITGSRVPDCTHACGPCSPCNRVMVSFKCSVGEPCPMVYRCMCRGNLFPTPSN